MARYLVTGCAGFIGSWIAEALLAQGEAVRGLDNFETGRPENLAAVEAAGRGNGARFEFCEVDLRDASAVAEACRGIELIFHQAALPSVPRSIRDPAHLAHSQHRRDI